MKVIMTCMAVVLLLLVTACGKKTAKEHADVYPSIFPDYTEVTIPANIAPLNFMVKDAQSIKVGIKVPNGELYWLIGKTSINIPQRKWTEILRQSRGQTVEVEVSVWNDMHREGIQYKRFPVHVSNDEIDPWVAYRLIPPGYEGYRYMGIFERNLTSFEVQPIIVNSQIHMGCVNCHSFADYSPSHFMFHARGEGGGTILYDNGRLEKCTIKRDVAKGASYAYWHPSGKYIAFSANATRQNFYGHSRDKLEVYDIESDLFVYDVDQKEIIADSRLNDSLNWETFPSFSPDGKTLYFCTAKPVKMPMEYDKLHYSIVKINFNSDGSLGETIDTLYNANTQGGSALLPRISPDGRYLLFTWAECGAFHIHHKEADLKLLDLNTNQLIPTDELNSRDVESYHSWASNGKWIIFSSKRVDTRYTRLFMAHWDGSKFGKPFMLPQKEPDDNVQLLYSYNIPEFLKEPVRLNKDALAKQFE